MLELREALRDALVSAFASRDEIFRICIFGREAEGRHDGYSDLDLIVYSNDPARTKADFHRVFEAINPIRAVFPLGGTPEWYAEMVMLRDYSPYHKVDFSIGGKEDWPKVTVYEDADKPHQPTTALEWVPLRDDAARKLTDVLFSVPRFTKCLYRRDVDMYRRWESITDLALVLLFERHFGWQPETQGRRLGPDESHRLLDALSAEEVSLLDHVRPADARLDLALSYQAAVKLIAMLCGEKARAQEVSLDTGFLETMLAFLDTEIARYLAQRSPAGR